MDKRNEYRVAPSQHVIGCWVAEYRSPRLPFGWTDWKRIDVYAGDAAKEQATAMCKAHAGIGAEYLGRLP